MDRDALIEGQVITEICLPAGDNYPLMTSVNVLQQLLNICKCWEAKGRTTIFLEERDEKFSSANVYKFLN